MATSPAAGPANSPGARGKNRSRLPREHEHVWAGGRQRGGTAEAICSALEAGSAILRGAGQPRSPAQDAPDRTGYWRGAGEES